MVTRIATVRDGRNTKAIKSKKFSSILSDIRHCNHKNCSLLMESPGKFHRSRKTKGKPFCTAMLFFLDLVWMWNENKFSYPGGCSKHWVHPHVFSMEALMQETLSRCKSSCNSFVDPSGVETLRLKKDKRMWKRNCKFRHIMLSSPQKEKVQTPHAHLDCSIWL